MQYAIYVYHVSCVMYHVHVCHWIPHLSVASAKWCATYVQLKKKKLNSDTKKVKTCMYEVMSYDTQTERFAIMKMKTIFIFVFN